MNRPLLITDCDEVLLHMVSHFRTWLDEVHEVDFDLSAGDYSRAVRDRKTGDILARDRTWPLLNGFFETEMHRQTLVPHAREALADLAEIADVVVLTNLLDQHQERRIAQLEAVGIQHRVLCNQGGKGTPVTALLEEYRPSAAVFVDDLALHHNSVARAAPQVFRLHMIAEPELAAIMPPAPDAHVRIDDWAEARHWIAARLTSGLDGSAMPVIGTAA
ncbi:HAD family hydrolase [Sphingomonas sp. ID1715]|uniref:HAD family hydrolase n=1 Tax=Sphingomonas sp. ID1715 TaxID=1656898 RepID=UPI00148942DD|nr:HAD family hydrolase [Sphingomonas sp. ID1715]NNM77406.1 HAD family hydrolase [Sphingomonas sp. ID1715]